MHIPSDVLYLVHATSQDPTQLKYLEPRPDCVDANNELQFPGVFMTLITKQNIKTQNIYSGKYVLIFSVDLLQQVNWHVNAADHNGNITEKNTFFPWNYEGALDKFSDSNEVVFHDRIDMKHLCKVLVKPSSTNVKKYMRYISKGGINGMLPKRRVRSTAQPDLTKQPFYVYNTETYYNGTTQVAKSSLAWFKMMARVAGISPIPNTKKEIIPLLQKQSKKICFERGQQDLTHLKSWTQKHT
jgi:hypothetical protein